MRDRALMRALDPRAAASARSALALEHPLRLAPTKTSCRGLLRPFAVVQHQSTDPVDEAGERVGIEVGDLSLRSDPAQE